MYFNDQLRFHERRGDLLESGRIEYAGPGLVMLYRSATHFERHIFTDDPRLTCDIV